MLCTGMWVFSERSQTSAPTSEVLGCRPVRAPDIQRVPALHEEDAGPQDGTCFRLCKVPCCIYIWVWVQKKECNLVGEQKIRTFSKSARSQMAMSQNPIPPVNIPIPTKIGSKMGGAPTPKWDPIGFDNHSHMDFSNYSQRTTKPFREGDNHRSPARASVWTRPLS